MIEFEISRWRLAALTTAYYMYVGSSSMMRPMRVEELLDMKL